MIGKIKNIVHLFCIYKSLHYLCSILYKTDFMAKNIFRGLGIALVTPFKKDGSVDFEALKRLIEYQLEGGADFFCILATTGETPCLTTDEKHEIKQFVVNTVARRVPILMGCGGNDTRTVVNDLKTMDFEGIDGVLSVGSREMFSLDSRLMHLPFSRML